MKISDALTAEQPKRTKLTQYLLKDNLPLAVLLSFLAVSADISVTHEVTVAFWLSRRNIGMRPILR